MKEENKMGTITYTERGGVEVPDGKGSYKWATGYSETTATGGISYPWMTMRQCQADARAQGAVAHFENKQAQQTQ
jgi:hypothetical protein